VFAIGTKAFSIFIEDNARLLFRPFGTNPWRAFPFVDATVATATTAELKHRVESFECLQGRSNLQSFYKILVV
jgi:hypothetical protein